MQASPYKLSWQKFEALKVVAATPRECCVVYILRSEWVKWVLAYKTRKYLLRMFYKDLQT